MSADASRSQFSRGFENMLNEEKFKVDINQKMKVPHRISFNPDANGINQSAWNQENYNMLVPERILVVGQQQHVGTRAPPREIVYDNSLLPTNSYPGDERVATPPRQLTLDKYPFPGFNDFDDIESEKTIAPTKTLKNNLNDSDLQISHRESTPPMGFSSEGLTTSEEVQHLRRQMAKLNRRVMALELEHLNRVQKEKILYGFGIAYFLLKAIFWLNRN